MDIRADVVYGHTGYEITSYFRSAFIKLEKQPKMPPPTALGRIVVARRFACPTNWWASCSMTFVQILYLRFTVQCYMLRVADFTKSDSVLPRDKITTIIFFAPTQSSEALNIKLQEWSSHTSGWLKMRRTERL